MELCKWCRSFERTPLGNDPDTQEFCSVECAKDYWHHRYNGIKTRLGIWERWQRDR